MKTERHTPVFHFQDEESFWDHIPLNCVPVGVELTEHSRNLADWHHPESAVYILGPEDGSLPPSILKRCVSVVRIPGDYCLNLAVAGSVVMYDRIAKSTDYRFERPS
jgi:tRNA(Leu) C34 or U34 (ribose-2'-O)-methylase TrmL